LKVKRKLMHIKDF